MKKYPHKVFERDRVVRDRNLRPLGRVILGAPYKDGEKLAVTLLRVPRKLCASIRGAIFYIDEVAYRIPADLDPVKMGGNKLEHFVNNFYMELVDGGGDDGN